MTSRLRTLAPLVVALLFLTACGARVPVPDAAPPDDQTRPTSSTTEAGQAGQDDPALTLEQEASQRAGGSRALAAEDPGPVPGGEAATGAGWAPEGDEEPPDSWIPLELTLSKTCARRGETMEAYVVTEPGMMIGFAAHYSDKQYTPDIHFVPSHTNTTGRHTWVWTLRPDTPLGPAEAEAVAGGGGKGNVAKVPFEVALRC